MAEEGWEVILCGVVLRAPERVVVVQVLRGATANEGYSGCYWQHLTVDSGPLDPLMQPCSWTPRHPSPMPHAQNQCSGRVKEHPVLAPTRVGRLRPRRHRGRSMKRSPLASSGKVLVPMRPIQSPMPPSLGGDQHRLCRPFYMRNGVP